MSKTYFSGCFFKTGLTLPEMIKAFQDFAKRNKLGKDFYNPDFVEADRGNIQIAGDSSVIDENENLAKFISKVIEKGEYTTFHSEYEGRLCDGWLVVRGKHLPVDFEGSVNGASVTEYAFALVGDAINRKERKDYRSGVVKVALAEVIGHNQEEFLDLISMRLVKSDLLQAVEYKVIGAVENVLYVQVSGFMPPKRSL